MLSVKKVTDIGGRYFMRISNISTSSTCCVDIGRRKKQHLPTGTPRPNLLPNPNAKGILTDGPDYSYTDGRPTPLGQGQRRRLMKQREYAERIMELSAELDFAQERYNRMQQEEKDKREQRLNSKLKPKEHLLLDK